MRARELDIEENNVRTSVWRTNIPVKYRQLPVLGKGATSIVLDAGQNKIIMITRDSVKVEWLVQPWGLGIGKVLEKLSLDKDPTVYHRRSRVLSEMSLYVLELPKLYPLSLENKRLIKKALEQLKLTFKKVPGSVFRGKVGNLQYAQQKFRDVLKLYLEKHQRGLFRKLVEFLRNYEPSQFSLDLHMGNFLQDARGKIVIIDPIVSQEILDELTGYNRRKLQGLRENTFREVSDKEREQMGSKKGKYSYVSPDEYEKLRPYLVQRSVSRAAKSKIDNKPIQLDPGMTAYTPGETLKLLDHPKVKNWFKRMETFKIPDEYGLVVLVGCAATKPWGFSCVKGDFYPYYNQIRQDVKSGKIKPIYFVTISEPLGVVPEDLWGDNPTDYFPQYDNPGLFKDTPQQAGMMTKDWEKSPIGSKREMPFDDTAFVEAIKKLGEVIGTFIKNNSDHEFVSFVEHPSRTRSTHSMMLDVAERVSGINIPRNPKKPQIGRKQDIGKYMRDKLELDIKENIIREAELTVDIPNSEWLQGKQEYAKKSGRDNYGVPYMGSTTGYIRGGNNIKVSVDILKNLPGMRGEQGKVRIDDLRAIMDIMKKTGKLPLGRNGKEYVPYIMVAYNGEAWVNEGNHRIMAAAKLGWSELPVEIKYFDGGEWIEDGPLYPPKIGLILPNKYF